MRWPMALLLLAGAMATGANAQGWHTTRSRTHPYNIPTPLADDPSAFVSVPAQVGFYGGMLAGLAPGLLVGLPLLLVDQVAQGEASQFSVDVVQAPAIYTGVAMQYAVGGPFYVTKALLWDFPGKLIYGRRAGVMRGF
ncbi:MAG TPA: hypothetical protein PLE19_15715 [Planctomycetota bacterium]|nr:hypothetical protein [Planctomycetota bacterium]HRR81348.1 hypothetical protein [Planctomycetota bacterium]HRT95362.1 hypothetical protein [Planctomycetota bacterium]